jgi:hypothetical protein
MHPCILSVVSVLGLTWVTRYLCFITITGSIPLLVGYLSPRVCISKGSSDATDRSFYMEKVSWWDGISVILKQWLFVSALVIHLVLCTHFRRIWYIEMMMTMVLHIIFMLPSKDIKCKTMLTLDQTIIANTIFCHLLNFEFIYMKLFLFDNSNIISSEYRYTKSISSEYR